VDGKIESKERQEKTEEIGGEIYLKKKIIHKERRTAFLCLLDFIPPETSITGLLAVIMNGSSRAPPSYAV